MSHLSPGIIGRFGDLIAESNLEAIQSFERYNCSKLCHDAIGAGICDFEDIPGFFKQTILLQRRRNPNIYMANTRLEFKINSKLPTMKWYSVFATSGPWAIKLYAKSLVRTVIEQTLISLKQKESTAKDFDFSFVHILARLFDLVHPTHQLQAAVLAYPLYGAQILKRRVLSLSYDLGGGNEDNITLDHKITTELVKQLQKKLDKEMKAYFEVIVPFKAKWRVGR